MSGNVHFPLYPDGANAHVTRLRFDNAAYMAYTKVTVTSQNNVFNIACFM